MFFHLFILLQNSSLLAPQLWFIHFRHRRIFHCVCRSLFYCWWAFTYFLCSVAQSQSCLTLCYPVLQSPRSCANSCLLHQWCHLTISFSVAPFSSCTQSFPAAGSLSMSQLFSSSSQSIGVLASVLPMNIQGWLPLGLTDLIFVKIGFRY